MASGHFSADTFRFLSDLAENNNREWFEENRQRYEDHIKEPLLDFIRDFAPALHSVNPNFSAIPRIVGGSMFRIYRDLRFSKDDRPYKTWAAAQFRHRQHSKDVHGPGFYLHIQPGECFMGAGIWHPDMGTLSRIRDSIVDRPGRWLEATRSDEFQENFELVGDSLIRAPRGYDPEHAQIEDLKRKDFIASKSFRKTQVLGADFLSLFTESCRQTAAFMRFLTEAVGLAW